MNNLLDKKFNDPFITADGNKRAFIEAKKINTLWFNTGTLCNIECRNCYIESSPKNDRLVYLTFDEVKLFIDEAIDNNLKTPSIINSIETSSYPTPAKRPAFSVLDCSKIKNDFGIPASNWNEGIKKVLSKLS